MCSAAVTLSAKTEAQCEEESLIFFPNAWIHDCLKLVWRATVLVVNFPVALVTWKKKKKGELCIVSLYKYICFFEREDCRRLKKITRDIKKYNSFWTTSFWNYSNCFWIKMQTQVNSTSGNVINNLQFCRRKKHFLEHQSFWHSLLLPPPLWFQTKKQACIKFIITSL